MTEVAGAQEVVDMVPRVKLRPVRRIDPLLSLILVNGAGGALVAVMIVSAIFLLDIGQMATLVAATDAPILAVALLAAGFVATFATAAASGAIMRIGSSDGDQPDDRELVPIRIRSRDRRR
jgi:hypothetical protein